MWLINIALRRPIMIIVLVISVALCSILAYQRMSVDICPSLDLPVIYVAQPYGGMNPAQMESFLVSTDTPIAMIAPTMRGDWKNAVNNKTIATMAINNPNSSPERVCSICGTGVVAS